MNNDSPFLDSQSLNDQTGQANQSSPFLDSLTNTTGSQDTSSPFLDAIPSDVSNAEQYVGTNTDSGYCESFVEKMTNGQNYGTSAADAFANQVAAGKGVVDPSLQGAKAGDKVYLYDPNQPNGHVGLLIDPSSGTFISAEPNGVKIDTLSNWLRSSGQSIEGYVPVD